MWPCGGGGDPVSDQPVSDEAVAAFRAGWLAETDLDEHISDAEIRAGLAGATPVLAAHQTARAIRAFRELRDVHTALNQAAAQARERVARYIDRAVVGKRATAAQGLSADTIVANAWAEVADWLRDPTIWVDGEESR